MPRRPIVAITNESTLVDDREALAVMAALQHQVDRHYQPIWGAGCHLVWHHKTDPIVPGAWVLAILDDSDQAGALGYHWLTDAYLPMGRVFAATDQQYGLSWSVTASHELLEMLGDPRANLSVQVDDKGTLLAYENSDAVEADALAYPVDGILVSDFQTPEWFVPGSDGPWDYAHHASQPLELLDGGYVAVWTPKKGWTQVTKGRARHEAGHRFLLRQGGHGQLARLNGPASHVSMQHAPSGLGFILDAAER